MLFIVIAIILYALRQLVQTYSLGFWFQEICLSSLGKSSPIYYRALICGQSLTPGHTHQWFQNWGLLHILVVSGAHFVFLEHHLEKVFKRLRLSPSFALPFLLLFCFATGLGPPVLRSALSLSLAMCSKRWKYNWGPPELCLLSGLLCLIYVPPHQHLSLQLSWLAALLISWPVEKSPLDIKKLILLWGALLPLLSGLSWSHPFSIVANALFLPSFELFIFPFVWMDQNLFNSHFSASFGFLSPLLEISPATYSSPLTDWQFKWLYLAVIQGIALTHRKKLNEA